MCVYSQNAASRHASTCRIAPFLVFWLMRPHTKALPLILDYPPDAVLNEVALAEALGCSPRYAIDLLKARTIRGQHTGHGGWRLTWRSVLAYLERE